MRGTGLIWVSVSQEILELSKRAALAFLHILLCARAEEHHGCSQGCGGGKGANGSASSEGQLATGWGLDWEPCSAMGGHPGDTTMGGSQGCHRGQLSCCVPRGPRDGRRGGPVAFSHLGAGSGSMEDALFPLNE